MYRVLKEFTWESLSFKPGDSISDQHEAVTPELIATLIEIGNIEAISKES